MNQMNNMSNSPQQIEKVGSEKKIVQIIDMPKINCPFVRKYFGKDYLVTPEINPGFEWVFTETPVFAVDKVDGTNLCIRIENGQIAHIFNRTTEKFIFNITGQTAWEGAAMEGISKAIQRGWLKDLKPGDNYGELIGPIINGNRHKLDYHLWVPFQYLKKTCFWKSFVQNKYPKTFESLSEWFREIPSLFSQRLKLPEIKAEGLVFYRANGEMAKLRRDMFDWYEGVRH